MKTTPRPKTAAVETSIIVRTFNEEKYLGNLFDAFDKQTYRDFEVIVVDSGSYDRTWEIASKLADQALRISSADFTFGFSLNQGIRAAKGKYIAIISAHTLPVDEHWLQRLVTPLKDEKTAMTYGRQRWRRTTAIPARAPGKRCTGAPSISFWIP